MSFSITQTWPMRQLVHHGAAGQSSIWIEGLSGDTPAKRAKKLLWFINGRRTDSDPPAVEILLALLEGEERKGEERSEAEAAINELAAQRLMGG